MVQLHAYYLQNRAGIHVCQAEDKMVLKYGQYDARGDECLCCFLQGLWGIFLHGNIFHVDCFQDSAVFEVQYK